MLAHCATDRQAAADPAASLCDRVGAGRSPHVLRRTDGRRSHSTARSRGLIASPSTSSARRRGSVAAVTLRRSLHCSLTCLRCTPMASANAPCVRPIGFMNSSTRISPIVAGLRFVINMACLTHSCDRPDIARRGGAERYPSIAFYGDDGFRRLNPSYVLNLLLEPCSFAFMRKPTVLTARSVQVICPSGSLLKGLSSLISGFPKNISVATHPKSSLEPFASHPTRGAYRDRHGRGVRMRWTRQRQARNVMAGRVGERPVSDQTAS